MNSEVTVKEVVEGGGRNGEDETKEEAAVDSEMNSGVLAKEEVEGGGGKGEEESKEEAAVDAEMNTEVKVKEEVEVEGGKGKDESRDESAVDAEMNPDVSVKEEMEGGRGKGDEESKDDETESSEFEKEDEEPSEASSSSEEDESSEESSSSNEEEQRPKKHGGVVDMEALIEKGELMAGIDDDDEEEEALKGPIKSKHEVEVRPPVPKVEVQLEPHHKSLPVGTVSTIMGERVIVEGSVQHNPLNEGSVLWITESRTPLGIVDELFGPVKKTRTILCAITLQKKCLLGSVQELPSLLLWSLQIIS